MTERPFIPRPPGEPAWWAEDAKPEELEAVVRERTARMYLPRLRAAAEQMQREMFGRNR